MTRLKLALVLGAPLLGLVACGGGDERDFAKSDAGTGATGAVAGSGGNTSGGTSGASGSGGATGGTAGSTGGSAGSTGGSAGAAGGTGGATGGAGGGTGGATGGAGGGTGGTAACNTTTNVCAPNAGAGWTGPIAFRKGAGAPPGCPGSYATSVTSGKAGLVPGAASCKCSCDPAAGISCTGTAKVYDVNETVLSCTQQPAFGSEIWAGSSSSCVKPTSGTSGKVMLVPPAPSNAGTCAAKPAHTLPTPTWSEETRICSGATPAVGTCASGQTCMPQPGAPYDVCVYRAGNVACPAGYGKKSLVYENFTDTRSCTACSCGSATSACGGSAQFASGCTGFPLLYTTVVGCGIPAGGIDITTSMFGSYNPSPSGTCKESTPTLTGTVTPSGEATVCCM